MKFQKLLALGLLSASLSTLAFADVEQASPRQIPIAQAEIYDAAPPVKSAHQGKTRAEVRKELIQAYRDGLIPTTEADYPPSKSTIERNKALFAESERHFR
ncbi:uncharacterized protein DUF4148 [Paraburkholderia sp. BL6669N2]|uniref:DUF4148 domain-containing protein n=1 Tax=Paraburkholderia sp. BL6669N2 TaxID=1938807 RepID=UPI000E22288D|nr:DUF4148 domain-containing protein [Paraburkholderia sp. BL6669N2]REG51897.1 uncharacterized protein DUF4148 [Paraburkholderia sp. BL6669N2]